MPTYEDQSGDDGDPAPALLRWADWVTAEEREESVEVIHTEVFTAVVRTSAELVSETPVDLIVPDRIETGTVKSCQADGETYVVTISLNPPYGRPMFPSDRDPGVFAIENFLTEEQEEKILREVEQEVAAQKKAAKAGAGPILLV